MNFDAFLEKHHYQERTTSSGKAIALNYVSGLLEQIDMPSSQLGQKAIKNSLYNAVWLGYHFATFSFFNGIPAAREVISRHGIQLNGADTDTLMNVFISTQVATRGFEPSEIVQNIDVAEEYRDWVSNFISRGSDLRSQYEEFTVTLLTQAKSENYANTVSTLLDCCSCAGIMIGLQETALLIQQG